MPASTTVPPYIQNTIVLKSDVSHHEEAKVKAAVTITPGMLIKLFTDGTVFPHGTAGGAAEKMFAKEDALQGKWLGDTYAAGDPCLYIIALTGDHILAYTAAGATSWTEGAALESDGAGGLRILGTGVILAYALQPYTSVGNATWNPVRIA